MSSYAALWCKSNGSFLEGASSPEELVEQAHALGLEALALTDRDGLYGIVAAHVRAQELEVRLLVGSQVTVDAGQLVLLVETLEGYRNLCRLLTAGRLRSPKGECQVTLEEVCQRHRGLLALWAPGVSLGPLRQAFRDRLYARVARHRLARQAAQEAELRASGLPLVAAPEVLYHQCSRRPLQDVLTCIRYRVTLASAGRLLRPNAEYGLASPEEMAELYADLPEALEATRDIARRCRFSMLELRYVYPAEQLAVGTSVQGRLEELTWAGAAWRYPQGLTSAIEAQLRKELKIIAQLDYGGYFLTLYDIVQFCQRERILCQGRGSAANSIVCYCLGITAVDPIQLDLLFERFLSLERAEPPDIDLDIAHQDRERVIQYVYRMYGRDRAAMVANLIRYRPRSAMRDVGKALGIDVLTVERFTRLMSYYEPPSQELLEQAGFDLKLPLHRNWLRLTQELMGFPRHLSIHPGGFLLGHEPVCELVPIENARMAGRTVIQWDKRDIEALGLFKVDLLALGALSLVDRCLRLLGWEADMAKIPREDPKTWDMLEKADTVGVFQIESRAQMSMLPRLRPRRFYDLVIQISIVRPGPISGGMVHPFLRRRNGQEPITYPHPCLEPILQKTLGVPLFQEQVIRLAMVAADYTGGEADQLRRDMGAWKSSDKIERHHQRLVRAMVAKGIPEPFAERVFEQIRGFGEYGFPESHAASFALIAYATAYLKCHHPAEFCCSLLNSQPMGFYSPLTIINDARRKGVQFLSIDVQVSAWDCTMEQGAVRMGLRYVKGLDERSAARLLQARKQGPFESLEEMARRARLERHALNCLARSGALQALGKSRRAQLWAAAALHPNLRDCPWLPGEPPPPLPELTAEQSLMWDCLYSSHSLAGHPLSSFREQLADQGLPSAEEVQLLPHGRSLRYAGVVICRQHPETARGVTFFTLEDETGFVNVVVRPQVFEAQSVLARSAGLLGVEGRLESRERVVHLVAERFFEPQLERPLVRVGSRDFR